MNWNDGSEDYNKLHEQGKLLDEWVQSRDRWKKRALYLWGVVRHYRLEERAGDLHRDLNRRTAEALGKRSSEERDADPREDHMTITKLPRAQDGEQFRSSYVWVRLRVRLMPDTT